MNIFYVYAYLDPRKPGKYIYGRYEFDHEPFYIGKGSLSRHLRHLKNWREKHNKLKTNKIDKIIKDGFIPIVKKIFINLSNDESLEIEKDMINIIGRITKLNGPLTNIDDGGKSSLIGYKHKEDYIKKLYRPVIKYDIDGNILDEYESVKDAGVKNQITPQTISSICNGSIKIYKNKYIFLYKGDVFQHRIRLKKQSPIIRIDFNGEISEYKSMQQAATENELSLSKISEVCRGDKFQHGSFLWRFKEGEKFENKIKEKYKIYLDYMNKKIVGSDGFIYKNILHVIYLNKDIKINNLISNLLNNKNYKFYEHKRSTIIL